MTQKCAWTNVKIYYVWLELDKDKLRNSNSLNDLSSRNYIKICLFLKLHVKEAHSNGINSMNLILTNFKIKNP